MAPRSTRQSALTKKHIARLERERQQTRLIIYFFGGIIVVVLGIIAYFALSKWVFEPRQAVANVNGEKITSNEFQARVKLQREQIISQYAQYAQFSQMFGMDFTAQLQQFQEQLADYNAEALGQNVLDSMINEILMVQEAEKMGITVSDEEVQTHLESAFGFFPNGEPSATPTATEPVFPPISEEQAAIVTITPTPGDPTATPTLTSTATLVPTITATLDLTTTATATIEPTATLAPTSTATLTPEPTATQTATSAPSSTPEPTATPLTEDGFTEKFGEALTSFKGLGFSEADYRGLMRMDLIRVRMFDKITADIKPVQDQVWARHILVTNEVAALTISDRLKKGEDFATLAQRFSQDTGSKDLGGDLGWFGRGMMVAPFEEAAFSLKPGEISKPVQSDFGWHIIQVIGHEERPMTADQFEQAKQDAFSKWIEELRTKADEAGLIEIFDLWKERVPLEPSLESAFGQQQQ
jgi:parvulin-like peptidyl-prolyl isomerase